MAQPKEARPNGASSAGPLVVQDIHWATRMYQRSAKAVERYTQIFDRLRQRSVWFRANSERHLSCRYNMSLLHCGGILYGCRRARWLTGQATGWRAPGNNAAASTSPLRNGSVPAQTACPNRSPSSMERPRSRPRPEALIGVKLPATCSDTFTDILQAIVMLVYGM
jgi:hypothetical protein